MATAGEAQQPSGSGSRSDSGRNQDQNQGGAQRGAATPTGAAGSSVRINPGWTATEAFSRPNLDYPHAVYVRGKGGRELPSLVPPSRKTRAQMANGTNPFGATQTDWVTSLHAPRVGGKQRRSAWPEYVPDSSAAIGRRWFGATLSDYREGGRLWDNSFGSSLDAHRLPTALPRLKDILQESVFPRGNNPASMGSRGRMGEGLHGAGVLPRGHGGYWAS